MRRWSRIVVAVLAGASCAAVGLWPAGAADVGPILARRILDDFEQPEEGRYGVLDRTLPPSAQGRLEWRREVCRRSHSTGRCLRLAYAFDSPTAEKVSFAIALGDLDASAYDHLEIWIRGDEEAGFSPALRIGLRRPKPGKRGLVEDGTALVEGLGHEWRRLLVPLNRMSGIRDWTHLRALFVSLEARRAGAARSGAYLIDDVALVRTGRPGPSISDEVVPRKKAAWVRSVGGAQAAKPLVQARLAGWPERLLADRASLPSSDADFLERLARDTWRGIAALTDRENGLPVDHVAFPKSSLAARDAQIGDYTNVTSVGLHLIAVAAARELGFVSIEEATARVRKVLDTLERLESRAGFFFNYYDTTSLERTSNLLSFIDSSWLTAGLMVVRSAFPELAARATRLIDAGDYRFFYDDVAQQMWHGYYVNVPTRSEYHYGVLYTEARLGSLVAIGKGDVPEEHWFALVRTYPPEADWQTQPPKRRRAKTVRGHRFWGGHYEWKGLRYVPSWGGSMFEALMPALVVDEGRWAPKSLGRNDEIHALVQRRFATEDLAEPLWGFSPSAVPGKGGYGEYGVKVLGALGYDGGVVAPYAAALALAVEPDEAVADLRRIAERTDAYGEYGFYDAVDPRSAAVAREYLALDQSMILIAAANRLKPHCVQELFAEDPIAARVLPMLGEEDFLD